MSQYGTEPVGATATGAEPVYGTEGSTTEGATTDQVNEALRVIGRARAQNRPYFVEVALNAPHDPFHKPPNDLH